MKRLLSFTFIVLAGMFFCREMNALPASELIQSTDNERTKTAQPAVEKPFAVGDLSETQQKKLNKKVRKLEKRLEKRNLKSDKSNAFNNVFGERYFILGSVFVLSGIALAVLGSITSFGFFGWLGGIAVIVGLVLIIIAILQSA